MHQLERLVLCNWGRLAPQDIPVRGMTAILGPTGAGKSTLVDAIQLIVTGSNSRYYDLNKSTGGKNARSIRDYCLGADDHVDPEAPARQSADSLLAMSFRDRLSGKAISIGLIYSADRAESGETVRARFVARDYAITIDDFVELRATEHEEHRVIPRAARLIERLKELCPGVRLHASGISYVDDYLHAMRPRGSAPHSTQVLRNFKESIAFQPIDDPTKFVRRHILEEDDIEVEALKGSIARYRFLEAEVKRREEQLTQIAEARRRMQVWAQYQIRHNLQLFTAASAERRRLEIEIERIEAQRVSLAEDLAKEVHVKRYHEQAIQQIGEDILRLKALLAEAPIASQIRGLDAELQAATVMRNAAGTVATRRIALLGKLALLAEHSERVPLTVIDGVRAVVELIELARGRPQDALLSIDDRLAELERRIFRVTEADAHFGRQIEVLDRQIDEERKRLDDLEGRLQGESTGQMLSGPVDRFRKLLAARGIEARPLPDLVDVSDAAWAMALEMLLGAHREALLVPAGHLVEAFGILYENRRELSQCRLIDVRKTARWQSRLPENSIASLIVTEDEDARVYIERQVGRFLMAETEADLERLDQAVTRRGKMTAGMSLRVYRDIVPILGKTAQLRALETARTEYQDLSSVHRRTRAARDALNTARGAIADILEAPKDELADALGRLAEAAAQLRGTQQAKAQLSSPESMKLNAEISNLQNDITRYRKEIQEEVEVEINRIQKLDVDLQVKLGRARQDEAKNATEVTVAQEREKTDPIARLLELLTDEERLEAASGRIAVVAQFQPEARDPAALLADLAAKARREAEPMQKLAEDSVRRGRSGYQSFIQEYVGQAPLADPDDVAILQWCMFKERQLEQDELRQYREQFEQARLQMEADLTEGLINRLSDKFQKAKAQIDRLNRSLAGRTFTGQTYVFHYRLNEALKSIHALAEAIANDPRRGLAVLQDDTLDPKVRAGFRDLERRLSDDERVKELRDYRQFFDFDVLMRNERGGETTLSKRAVTGSGGQKQAPYYVAVGAAMAAAYYPKSAHEEPDGFGLVVFDEAFNNLDAPNTRALLNFFRDMHLQVLVAAPDKVRAMFLENADTIVSVNRRPDNQEPIVVVTHPSVRAREALAALNPVNLGVNHFREIELAVAP
ncbi:SbcC/MukB-like Walker B domain-containing protein [Novosphingobium terrae]|uniref:SbcC/MukB-like Walker B domain-containing protein n=1 Tax=Novosphingobium terrae TaxID=2726189 RepID=UPI001981C495|nr:SbcC/MukB-like Walker B domain-containing protein [Novosphingobium terrae]